MTTPPPTSTLFPYTTLFRSVHGEGDHAQQDDQQQGDHRHDGARTRRGGTADHGWLPGSVSGAAGRDGAARTGQRQRPVPARIRFGAPTKGVGARGGRGEGGVGSGTAVEP